MFSSTDRARQRSNILNLASVRPTAFIGFAIFIGYAVQEQSYFSLSIELSYVQMHGQIYYQIITYL